MSEDILPIKMISDITLNRGLMWEKIAEFQNQLESLDESMSHKAGDVQSEQIMETFTLKQNIEGGL